MKTEEKIKKLEDARKLMSDIFNSEISDEKWYHALLNSAGTLEVSIRLLKKNGSKNKN